MISLLHPSRGRPHKSHDNATEWLRKSGVPTELIVSIDSSDPSRKEYESLYRGLIVNDNKSVVEATNRAASEARSNILVYLSDDFVCPNNWGKLIVEEFAKYTGPTLIKVDDCLQKFDVPVLTIPMMNRALYKKLGYFWHPAYKSMFCDEHLYWRSKKLNALRMAAHLKFEHHHVSVGKAKDDETYRRSAANWDQGKALFAQHKSQGFCV